MPRGGGEIDDPTVLLLLYVYTTILRQWEMGDSLYISTYVVSSMGKRPECEMRLNHNIDNCKSIAAADLTEM